MNNPFNFFEKIFCINLDERVDRWDKCQNKFSQLGISERVERFPAIKFEITDERQAKAAGRAGCALSHSTILDKAIENNLSNYLVLEDDFDLSPTPDECLLFLANSIKQLPENWDLFYLGGNLTQEYGIFPLDKFDKDLFKLKSCHTTHSFAVNSSFYNKLKEELPTKDNVFEWLKSHDAIDVHLSKTVLAQNNTFIPSNILFVQQPDFSDIENNFYDYVSWMESNFANFKTALLS